MTYTSEDIELMLSDFAHMTIHSLDQKIFPQQRRFESQDWHLPFHSIPRKAVNSLIHYFQNNPIDLEEDWTKSNIPFFVWDVRKFSEDKDVKRLIQIPNVKDLRSERMD